MPATTATTPATTPATLAQAQQLGLLPEEFAQIEAILGRTPNFTELSAYSVMWSEHCSYKNSIRLLKTLPRDGAALLVAAGEENAGLVDVGHGLGCAFKIESHNHPSAIEPYQGAATGVGGINRDIFTMGARPIAQLNSLRFGRLSEARTRWIIDGVVRGISHYGNAFGVPVVGGEVYFDDSFTVNPLVNAMSVGIVPHGQTVSATSHGAGNPVFIVGAATGKDGIHGASFASGDLNEDSAKDLPAVQVGDPFMEKLLMEATLEAVATGALVGMQDMGAAGIICSTSEMSAKGGAGMRIHLEQVPTRQAGMEPYQLLLSESQERMLMVCHAGREADLLAVFAKWDVACAHIGTVTDGGLLEFYMHGTLVASLPAESLVLGGGAPVYTRESREPAYVQELAAFRIGAIAEPAPAELPAYALQLATHPNLASKRYVTRQYDNQVGTLNMSANTPSSAAIVSLRGTDTALALTVDCNSRYVQANPRQGAAMAVAEAARNIVCSGGTPLAITNCLNFGNPYNPEVYWQFEQAIAGMGEACRAFGTPVTGGNVSFYNQSSYEGPVMPSPVIGMLGTLPKARHTTLAFGAAGDAIVLVGPITDDLCSSQYLYSFRGVKQSPAPQFDMATELAVQQGIASAIGAGLVASANDLADGGLWATLLESAMPCGLGFHIALPMATPAGQPLRMDGLLFGEAASRAVLTATPQHTDALLAHLQAAGVPALLLGHVQAQGKVVVNGQEWLPLAAYAEGYDTALERIMEGVETSGGGH